jgi:hypothetical protein
VVIIASAMVRLLAAIAAFAAVGAGMYLIFTRGGKPFGLSSAVIVAADLRHVDVTELLDQSRALAQARHPRARLASVVARGVSGGKVDATAVGSAGINYDYRFTDPARPPGQQVVAGSVTFAVAAGQFRIVETLSPPDFEPTVLEEPKCTSEAAWKSALRSGFAPEAKATFTLTARRAGEMRGAPVWVIDQEGGEQLRREVDARTCAALSSGSSGSGGSRGSSGSSN